ncbi:MAG: putative esterase YcpF (UPF0227 family) [Halieaceae bacterium]
MSGTRALIYIHGYSSSPQSQKAVATQRYLTARGFPVEYRCPQLSDHPAAAIRQLTEEIESCASAPALIGSSMGGFYASYLTELLDLPSVLINPAVAPAESINKILGPNVNPYTGVEFTLTEADVEHCRQFDLPVDRARARSMLLLETGDETLDYRQALSHYEGVFKLVEQGGDHRCQSYERHLPFILNFLGVIL